MQSLFDNARQTLKSVIMDMIEKTPLDAITDEAHTLDTEFCVSALQLAIDCRDLDFVKAIAEKLKQADKWQGGTLYISEDYLTPLQYAVLQYDYLVQFDMMLGSGYIQPLEMRGMPHRKIASGGIQKEDRDFYADRKIERRVRALPEETAGLYIARGTPRSLFEIIKYLASETNPISVDTFYLIADQMDSSDNFAIYTDVEKLVHYMINTGHADLCGTNFEWDRGKVPQETLLAKCIRIRNYDLMRLLLEEYADKLKGIINELITGFCVNPQGKMQFKHETDLHFFVLNQIESAKMWHDDNRWHSKKEQDDYGKQIAHTLFTILSLFKQAGARFDIPDAKNKTVADYLREWKDKFPAGSIPENVEARTASDDAS